MSQFRLVLTDWWRNSSRTSGVLQLCKGFNAESKARAISNRNRLEEEKPVQRILTGNC